MVDAGSTSDPAIYAAGDVTNHPNALFDRRMRLESVHNAMEQAKTVARTIAGQPQAYADVPWFWSDQYDLKLQIAGVGDPDDELILRGDPATRVLLPAPARRAVGRDHCVNRGADFLAAKKLIAERRQIDFARAADPGGQTGDLGGQLGQLVEDDPVEHAARDGRAVGDHDLAARDHGWIRQSESNATRSASRPAAMRPLRASPVASATLAVTTRRLRRAAAPPRRSDGARSRRALSGM